MSDKEDDTVTTNTFIRIECPDCKTRYKLPADRLTGSSLRCSACGVVFSIPLPKDQERENTGGYRLRPPNGEALEVGNVAAIKRGLINGTIIPGSEVSKAGGSWTALDKIPELASYLRIARSQISEANPDLNVSSGAGDETAETESEEAEELSVDAMPNTNSDDEVKAVPSSAVANNRPEQAALEKTPDKSSSAGLLFLIVSTLIILGVLAYFLMGPSS